MLFLLSTRACLGCCHMLGSRSFPSTVKWATSWDHAHAGILHIHSAVWADPTCLTSRVSRESPRPWQTADLGSLCTYSCRLKGFASPFIFYLLLPWQTSHVPIPPCFPFSLTQNYFPLKEKQANEYVKNIFCGSLGSSIARNQYDPNFIANV